MNKCKHIWYYSYYNENNEQINFNRECNICNISEEIKLTLDEWLWKQLVTTEKYCLGHVMKESFYKVEYPDDENFKPYISHTIMCNKGCGYRELMHNSKCEKCKYE